MATVIGLTAARMQQIEAASVVDGEVVAGNLILTKHDGSQINAGSVIGPTGPMGPIGAIPGEIKLWPGSALPDLATYGRWVWANGAAYDVVDYPLAAANIATAWKTAAGNPDPGAGKFRVPDLRGLVPAGPDAMPTGSARANRMTRAIAITIAAKTGEETHMVTVAEMPAHSHTEKYNSNRNLTAVGNLGGNEPLAQGDTVGAIDSRGGNAAHENIQPTIMVPYIVSLAG